MTVPILQIPLTVGVHTNAHTYIHTPYNVEHLPLSSASVCRHLQQWSLHCGTQRTWLRKPPQLCRQLRVKNTPWLFGQRQHESILDKWVSFSMSHSLQECACVCACEREWVRRFVLSSSLYIRLSLLDAPQYLQASSKSPSHVPDLLSDSICFDTHWH